MDRVQIISETSNAPLRRPTHRRDVQFIIEMSNSPTRRPNHHRDIKSQSKSRDRIYLEPPNDRCDELDKCNNETGKTQCDQIIRHPHDRTIRPMQPDDLTPEKKGRTIAWSILQRGCFHRVENYLHDQMIRHEGFGASE